MSRRFLLRCLAALLLAGPVFAASDWTGSADTYPPLTHDAAQASVDELRALAAAGELTPEAVLKAAAEIKAVRQSSVEGGSEAQNEAQRNALQTALPVRRPAVYARAGSGIPLSIDDSADPLSSAQSEALHEALSRIPPEQLSLLRQIRIQLPQSDPDKGQLFVTTQGGVLTIYGTDDLASAVQEGMASALYAHLQGTAPAKQWQNYGTLSEFIQAYDSWAEGTPQALQEAAQSENAGEELSKLMFVGSLFGDASGNRVTIYDPTPEDAPWGIRPDGRYGFGAISFEVDHNQIVHLAYGSTSLGTAAADIPASWAQQGLGN